MELAYGNRLSLQKAKELGVLDTPDGLLVIPGQPMKLMTPSDLPVVLSGDTMADDTQELKSGAKKIYNRVSDFVTGKFLDPGYKGPDANDGPGGEYNGPSLQNPKWHDASSTTSTPASQRQKPPKAPVGKDAAKPNTYKDGGVVEKTGLAKVHEGERVLTKEQQMGHGMYDMAKEGMAGGEEKPKKEISHITVRKAKNGHIIEHHHTHPSHKMEEHVAKDKMSMLQHLADHTPDDASTTPAPEPAAAQGPLSEATGAATGA